MSPVPPVSPVPPCSNISLYHLYHPAAIFHYITCTTLQQYSIISPVPPCSSKQYITCITHITRIARIILQQYTTRACYKQKLWSLCRRHSIKSAPILWDYVVVVAIRSGTVFWAKRCAAGAHLLVAIHYDILNYAEEYTVRKHLRDDFNCTT